MLINTKAMRSVNLIEYSIKNRVETNIWQKYSSDYDAIIFVNSNLPAIFLCRKFEYYGNNFEKIVILLAFGNAKKTFWGWKRTFKGKKQNILTKKWTL